MPVDAFSVLVAFLAALEGALGVVLLVLGIRDAAETRKAAALAEGEDRRPLLALLAATGVAIAVASWPLHYLLLGSWVVRWPGIMCVEGVRRIGTGSLGPAGALPTLVRVLDVLGPAVLFLAGAWALLHGIARRVASAVARRRAAWAAAVLGFGMALGGAAEIAYVAIPKQEVRAEAGCCTQMGGIPEREEGLTARGAADEGDGALGVTFVGAAAGLGLASLGMRRFAGEGGNGVPIPLLGGLAAGSAASLPLAVSFLVDVAAPRVLGLPYHRCAWCAFSFAPETIVGTALHLSACCCAGWALLARVAAPAGADPRRPVRGLLTYATFGFFGTAGMSATVLCLG